MKVRLDPITHVILQAGSTTPDGVDTYEGAPDDYSIQKYTFNYTGLNIDNTVKLSDFTINETWLVEQDLEVRQQKLNDVIIYMRTQLISNNTEFAKFIVDSRVSRDDYANGTDAFITWVNNTFPTKTYYTLARKTDLINILN